MSKQEKRAYNSKARKAKGEQTRKRILDSARDLFQSIGFEKTTIEQIANNAEVSSPTIYALFQSKRGILRDLLDEALPPVIFQDLVEKSVRETSPQLRLAYSAKIARRIYDAEREQMDLLREASVLSSEFKELEQEREARRYLRQQATIESMVKEHSLVKGLKASCARDILWAFTGRDLYRLFVVERGWSSNQYETWLAKMLIKALVED